MAEHGEYVTRSAWLREVGRPDLVDEVADQFERPVPPTEDAGWPRRSRGWRSWERLHPHPDRVAG
jgi:hypothetical protein